MKSSLKVTGLALCLLTAPLLHATPVFFSLSGSGHVFTFSLDSNPTPDGTISDGNVFSAFFLNNIAVSVDGGTPMQDGVEFVDILFNGKQDLVIAGEIVKSSPTSLTPRMRCSSSKAMGRRRYLPVLQPILFSLPAPPSMEVLRSRLRMMRLPVLSTFRRPLRQQHQLLSQAASCCSAADC